MNKNSIVRRQVNALNDLKLFELKDKFREVYGFEPGYTTATKLRRRIAYRLQEICIGGLSEAAKKQLSKIADGDSFANLCQPGAVLKPTIRGVRYSRVWKGAKYEVITVGNGSFEFDGKIFKSLSAIAREITGTRWNGKIFFGVK